MLREVVVVEAVNELVERVWIDPGVKDIVEALADDVVDVASADAV